MCLLIQCREQGHRSQPVCSCWTGRNAILRRHQANPHWEILWKRTCLDSGSIKAREDNGRMENWSTLDQGDVSAQHNLWSWVRAQKSKMTSARSEGPQVTHYFPIWVIAPCFKNHICLFVIYLFIVCLYVGGCTCLSEHVESDANQQELVFSFYLWVPGI